MQRGNKFTTETKGPSDTHRQGQRKRRTVCVPGPLPSSLGQYRFIWFVPFQRLVSSSLSAPPPRARVALLLFFLSLFLLLSRLFMRATGTHRQFNSVLGPPNQCAVLKIEGPFLPPFPWGWKGEPGRKTPFRLSLGLREYFHCSCNYRGLGSRL